MLMATLQKSGVLLPEQEDFAEPVFCQIGFRKLVGPDLVDHFEQGCFEKLRHGRGHDVEKLLWPLFRCEEAEQGTRGQIEIAGGHAVRNSSKALLKRRV